MKTKALIALVLFFGLLHSAWPEASPTPSAAKEASLPPIPTAPDAAALTQLLKDFLAGASRNDITTHDRFWAPELIYTSSSGRRLSKADIIREVREEGAPKPEEETTNFTAEDIRIQQYEGTAIVAFRLVGTTQKKEKTEVANYLNTGTFLKREGQWRAVAWQATVLPANHSSDKK